MRSKTIPSALLATVLFLSAPHLRAQVPTETSASRESRPVSPSIASGDRSEPAANEKVDPAEELKKPSPTVAKLGSLVGMSPEASVIAFNWLNFLILAGVLVYALMKSLPKAFRSRTEKIQKNIVEARVATEEARGRLAAVEARLGRLDAEIAHLRAENDQAAAEEDARIHAQAEEEKGRIVQAAEQEIAAASAAAQRSLRAYAAEIAVNHAASQLQITADDDRMLIESFAGKLGAEGSRN